MVFKVIVIDKSTKQIYTSQGFETKAAALKEIVHLKENNFNPAYFDFVLKEE